MIVETSVVFDGIVIWTNPFLFKKETLAQMQIASDDADK